MNMTGIQNLQGNNNVTKIYSKLSSNSLKQSLCWVANSHSAGQEIYIFFWNPKDHCYVYKSLYLDPFLNHIASARTSQPVQDEI
jgi:hypothetical protein